jgi:hypothetical protein
MMLFDTGDAGTGSESSEQTIDSTHYGIEYQAVLLTSLLMCLLVKMNLRTSKRWLSHRKFVDHESHIKIDSSKETKKNFIARSS